MIRMRNVAGLLLSLSSATIVSCELNLVTYYSIRSQGVNAARRLVGQTNFINLPDATCPYGSLSVATGYTQTFRQGHITDVLFGKSQNCCDTTIGISGSTATSRGANDWLADYFYLPTDFQSTVDFSPRISNFFVDLGYFLGLDEWKEGLYCAFYAPFVHSRWDLNLHENVIYAGIKPHVGGYFTPQVMSRGNLLKSFAMYAGGLSPEPVAQPAQETATQSTGSITVSFDPLERAKMSSQKLVKSRFAEFRGVFGWNFYDTECGHAGIALHFVAPTGNRPEGRYLFEPIVGNGHHYEFGGEIQWHNNLWSNEDESFRMSFYGDVIITHLFGTRQYRTFDLKGKPFSRYMLASLIDSDREQPQLTGDSDAGVEFQRNFSPVANLTTFKVDVSIGVQADIVAMVHIDCGDCLDIDIGYNFWATSCENISLRCSRLDTEKVWALKGDSYVYGYAPTATAVALAPSESKANIHTGTNVLAAVPSDLTQVVSTNPGIDNPQSAETIISNATVPVNNLPGGADARQTRTSNKVVFLKTEDVNVCGRETQGMSSKLFANISCTFDECEGWIPFLGVGGEIEIDHSQRLRSKPCLRTAISQWGLWLKGGVSFN